MATPTTWGPFTGRQLTTIIVALIAGGVALPSAVWAVDTFSNVAIEDPVSGAKASVDATHHVLVGDGSGGLTVDGTVNARETSYAAYQRWATLGISSSTSCATVATPAAGKALLVKAAHVDVYTNPSPGAGQRVTLFSGPPSSPCSTVLDDVNPGSIGVTTLDFGVGVALPAGNVLAVQGAGSVQAELYAFGYQIAGSSAPPAAAASSPAGAPHQAG